jgi:protein-tyrosine phosphatase
MAAGILRRELGADAERVQVESAGTAAWEGQPATDPSIQVADREGIDLRAHRSRRVGPAMVRAADLILVMEKPHVNAVRTLGAAAERVHLLSEWPPPGEPELPISDPFGGSLEAYEECWNRITRHLRRGIPHIREAFRTRSA